MEIRNLNIIWSKSGSGSPTAKISLPVSWLYEMGLSSEERSVEVKFWDWKGQERISIEKRSQNLEGS